MEYKTISLIPRLSEKAFALSKESNTFIFSVPRSASKATIARAVNIQFDVSVQEIRVINQKGKAKRTIRRGGRPVAGTNSDFKKAYVTLKEGDSLPFFLGENDNSDAKEASK
jgi:large subunit ribosomal protein L23